MFDSVHPSQMDAAVTKNALILILKDLFNRQSNSDHVIKKVTYTCVVQQHCQIQYSWDSIVFQFQSF